MARVTPHVGHRPKMGLTTQGDGTRERRSGPAKAKMASPVGTTIKRAFGVASPTRSRALVMYAC